MPDIDNVISNLWLNIRWISGNPAHHPGYRNVEMAMRDAEALLQWYKEHEHDACANCPYLKDCKGD